jgi:hypothetical protein
VNQNGLFGAGCHFDINVNNVGFHFRFLSTCAANAAAMMACKVARAGAVM